ncbi:hypothetical protein Bhyg_07967 [Pseudolycoriella hygida]|uniref:Uncharacterized protein n=1 Tax=Pseudolycoriella hygida TaxID=35572 RepID=A0A9Q0N4Z6_9DIPT|nr:hypothetical protein Bhyg_07967 [Pseudolycoriella hygida]
MDAKNLIEDVDDDMPLELMEHARTAKLETLPVKSREKYIRVYIILKRGRKSMVTLYDALQLRFWQTVELICKRSCDMEDGVQDFVLRGTSKTQSHIKEKPVK